MIAGADAGADAEEVAHAGGWPLIAEIVSGARFGRQVVHGYRRLLSRDELGGRIERVVVLGHPTLSREVAALLARTDVDVIAVRRGGEDLNLNHRTRAVGAVSVAPGPADRAWLGDWLQASAAEVVDLSENAPDPDGLASTDFAARRDAVKPSSTPSAARSTVHSGRRRVARHLAARPAGVRLFAAGARRRSGARRQEGARARQPRTRRDRRHHRDGDRQSHSPVRQPEPPV